MTFFLFYRLDVKHGRKIWEKELSYMALNISTSILVLSDNFYSQWNKNIISLMKCSVAEIPYGALVIGDCRKVDPSSNDISFPTCRLHIYFAR